MLSIELISEPSSLELCVEPWKRLAEGALERNPFYEHWFLIPAFRHLAAKIPSKRIRILMIRDGERLLGVFPLESEVKSSAWASQSLKLWRHEHCFLCTPLIDRERAAEVLDRFLLWLKSEHGSGLMSWSWVGAGGGFEALLKEALRRARFSQNETGFERASFKVKPDFERYLNETVSPKHLKEYRRHESRLKSDHALSFESGGSGSAREFLNLEASGWKGQEGTALKSNPADQAFFESMAELGLPLGKLSIIGFKAQAYGQSEPGFIAMKCILPAGDTAFAFKIAYDEAWKKYRPGLLLELRCMQRLGAEDHDYAWIDSCADPGHPLMDRLMTDRRQMLVLNSAYGIGRERLWVLLLPLAREIRSRLKNRRVR